MNKSEEIVAAFKQQGRKGLLEICQNILGETPANLTQWELGQIDAALSDSNALVSINQGYKLTDRVMAQLRRGAV